MSYQNRLNEYKRLKSLGREKDIPQSLRDEFDKPIIINTKNEEPKAKKKESKK